MDVPAFVAVYSLHGCLSFLSFLCLSFFGVCTKLPPTLLESRISRYYYVKARQLNDSYNAMAIFQTVTCFADSKKQAPQSCKSALLNPLYCNGHKASSVEAALNVMPASTSLLILELIEVQYIIEDNSRPGRQL